MKIYHARETTCRKLLREQWLGESTASRSDRHSAESLIEIENIVQRTLYMARTQMARTQLAQTPLEVCVLG